MMSEFLFVLIYSERRFVRDEDEDDETAMTRGIDEVSNYSTTETRKKRLRGAGLRLR